MMARANVSRASTFRHLVELGPAGVVTCNAAPASDRTADGGDALDEQLGQASLAANIGRDRANRLDPCEIPLTVHSNASENQSHSTGPNGQRV